MMLVLALRSHNAGQCLIVRVELFTGHVLTVGYPPAIDYFYLHSLLIPISTVPLAV